MRRYDTGRLKNARILDDGRLMADVIVSRTGVLDYRNADGSARKEFRDPDEVFKLDSLATMNMIPVTDGHPSAGLVTSENVKELGVGQTGENARADGIYVMNTLTVNNQDVIEKIMSGKQELSLGYQLDLDESPGEHKGIHYDAVQKNIKYNHLALVVNARAGSQARISLDSGDAIQINKQQEKPEMEKNLLTVNLDGIEYQASPEVKKELDRLISRADKAEGSVSTIKEEKTTLQAKFDSQKEELEKLKNVDNSEEIKTAVDARISLVSSALKHLDSEESKEIELKTDSEIKIAVIKKYSADFKADEKDDTYIQARFDIALENTPKKKGVADQRQQMQNTDGTEPVINSDEARKNMYKTVTNAHKGETK